MFKQQLRAWSEIPRYIYVKKKSNNMVINYSLECDTQDLVVDVFVLCREILVLS